MALDEEVYPVPEWPLALHRHYSRREIVAAVGYMVPGKKGSLPHPRQVGRRLLPVHALPRLRHQPRPVSLGDPGAASVTSASGRRYIDSPGNGWMFYLFVRPTRDDAYAFLGPVQYAGYEGDRPIAITWKLLHPMPGALFDAYASLASA